MILDDDEGLDPNRPGYVDGWKVITAPGAGYDYCDLCGAATREDEEHEPGCPNTPDSEDLAQIERDRVS